MPNLNKCHLIGHVTRNPEPKHNPGKTPICSFSLAINRYWNKDGESQQEVTFVDITAFGKQADVILKNLKKGEPFYVEGRLKLDQWEAQDGGKRSKLYVILDSFQFLGGSREASEEKPRQEPRQEQGVVQGFPTPRTPFQPTEDSIPW